MIIGLNGYAQSGKDTVGQYLSENYGFSRVSFAGKLKEFCMALSESGAGNDEYARLVNGAGSLDKAKVDYPLVRQTLQHVGVTARNVFGEDFWINMALPSTKFTQMENLVVTDVRFQNEADAIVRMGGKIWRVKRPGYGPVNSHVSENLVVDPDSILTNDGSIDQLFGCVDNIMAVVIKV